MKKTITLFIATILSVSLIAETVKLKITYKSRGISGHTVYVMVGDVSLGSGITNSGGEVSIDVSTLPSKNIDVKGEKKCNGAEKNWKVQGYVTLDDNNYALLELDKPIAEVVESSGGFMTEDMIVSSYGLICGGSDNSSGSNNSTSETPEVKNKTIENISTDNSKPTSTMPSREEMLANQKVGYQNKINSLNKKIAKNKAQIEGGKLDTEKQKDTEYDIQEMEIEKKIAQNNLDRVNTEIANGSLNKEERERFKTNDKTLKEELKSVKQEHKETPSPSSSTTSERTTDISNSNMSDTDIANMETKDLKTKRIDYKSKLGAQKLKLKTRKKYMTPEEIAETEANIKTLEANIAKLDAELSKRDGK